jgi:hypothetical protein
MDEQAAHATPPAPDSPLADPRALTILTTEHWSLLSARSLVYNEAFARGGMFLTFLSGTFVALGLLSTATHFSREFLTICVFALGLDLFVGLATLGRVAGASMEDLRYLQGMNRLRHAYHEIVPGLEPYFVTAKYDDLAGVYAMYTPTTTKVQSIAGVAHGLTTTMGMLAVVNASIAAALVGVLVLLAIDVPLAAIAAGVAVLVAGFVGGLVAMFWYFDRNGRAIKPTFPTPRQPSAPSIAKSRDGSEADAASA